jgi:N-methylhydantoinase A/oxoprolinase/acetone carboxylase beta subunit
MRYKGQAFELTVPAAAVLLDQGALDQLIAGFHDMHRQRFSYSNPGQTVEIVSLRVSAIGQLPKPQGGIAPVHGERSTGRHRTVWIGGRWREIACWNRGQIALDTPLEGPAVIEDAYTTVLIAEGWTCRRDRSGHLIAERAKP